MRLVQSPLLESYGQNAGAIAIVTRDIFFPSSGAPPISPAFDASWTDTSGAVRILAGFKKISTADVDTVTANPTGVTTYRKLLYQFVLPLTHRAIFCPVDRLGTYRAGLGSPPFSIPGLGGFGSAIRVKAKVASGTGPSLCSHVRVVDSAGAVVAPVSRTVTATFTIGSATLASASAFVKADIGAELYVPSVSPDYFPYNVLDYTSASALKLSSPIQGGSPWTGSLSTQLRRSSNNKATSWPTDRFDTTVKGHGACEYQFLDYGGSQATGGSIAGIFYSMTRSIADSYFLVIEVGYTQTSNTNLLSAINVTTRLGDSSSSLVAVNGTTGSTGIEQMIMTALPNLLSL